MDDYLTRARIVKLRVDRTVREAESTRDPERLEALRDELDLLVTALEEIHEEQLISMLPKPKSKRRWWQRKAVA